MTATTTSAAKMGLLEQLGAAAVVMDGLDAVSVDKAVAEARPDAIVHQMTAIAGMPDMRHIDRWFATTNRLRTEGADRHRHRPVGWFDGSKRPGGGRLGAPTAVGPNGGPHARR